MERAKKFELERFACVCFTGAMKTSASRLVLLGLTSLHVHIRMQARRTIFIMSAGATDEMSFLNRGEINIVSRWYLELSTQRSSMTKKFNFDKKFKIR